MPETRRCASDVSTSTIRLILETTATSAYVDSSRPNDNDTLTRQAADTGDLIYV
jgi:hypothetical protein